MIACETLKKFTDDLSSKSPVPGGGGASAVEAALGASLGLMVIHLTQGKKKYAEYEEILAEYEEKLTGLRDVFFSYAEKDEEVFLPLSKAYKLPTETAEQKEEKDRVMETLLKEAASVPLQLMELIMEAMTILTDVAKIGSKLAISDAGCALAAFQSALTSASFNVAINCKALKNEETSDAFWERATELLDRGACISEDVLKIVYERM